MFVNTSETPFIKFSIQIAFGNVSMCLKQAKNNPNNPLSR